MALHQPGVNKTAIVSPGERVNVRELPVGSQPEYCVVAREVSGDALATPGSRPIKIAILSQQQPAGRIGAIGVAENGLSRNGALGAQLKHRPIAFAGEALAVIAGVRQSAIFTRAVETAVRGLHQSRARICALK